MKKETSNHNTNGSAIVVGGSLSGLMAGIALAREGVKVTIVEKSGEYRPPGAGLQVDGGLFDRNKTARLLRKLASDGKSSVQLWSKIESNLRGEAKSDNRIVLRFDTRVQTVDQDDHSAWVVTDAGETIQGDILIGADGHRSVVRPQISSDKPNASFSGYMVWFAAINDDELPKAERPKKGPGVTMLGSFNGFMFGSVFDRQGVSGPGNRRIGCTMYDNQRNDVLRRLGCVEGNIVKHSLKGEDMPEDLIDDMIEEAYDRWPKPWLHVMVHAIKTRSLNGIPIKEYIPDRLVKGRLALLGDAAHAPAPITASGFNASLEDAVTLGKSASNGVQGQAAIDTLQKYEDARLNTVRSMVSSGQSFSMSFGRP